MTQLQEPPVHLDMPETAQVVYTVVLGTPLVVFFCYALYRLVQKRSPVAMVFFLGGCLNVFAEPVVDVLAKCWFPEDGQWTALETFERPLPVFLVVAYPWFIGGQGYLVWKLLERGAEVRDIWRLWLGIIVLDSIFVQFMGTELGTFTYYGDQPLEIRDAPLWWPFADAVAPILAGTLMYRLHPYLPGMKIWLGIGFLSFNYVVVHAFCSWPVWTALNTDVPAAVDQAAGVATVGLAALAVWILITAAGLRGPVARVPLQESECASRTSTPERGVPSSPAHLP